MSKKKTKGGNRGDEYDICSLCLKDLNEENSRFACQQNECRLRLCNECIEKLNKYNIRNEIFNPVCMNCRGTTSGRKITDEEYLLIQNKRLEKERIERNVEVAEGERVNRENQEREEFLKLVNKFREFKTWDDPTPILYERTSEDTIAAMRRNMERRMSLTAINPP